MERSSVDFSRASAKIGRHGSQQESREAWDEVEGWATWDCGKWNSHRYLEFFEKVSENFNRVSKGFNGLHSDVFCPSFASWKLFCWCWTDIFCSLRSSQRFCSADGGSFQKCIEKTYTSNLSSCFCQRHMKHKQDWQRPRWWERKRCTVSYVMQQSHCQGNRRSNVLTSLVSLCCSEHLELLKWANITWREKNSFSAVDHQDVWEYVGFPLTDAVFGGKWRLVTTCNLAVDKRVRASNLLFVLDCIGPAHSRGVQQESGHYSLLCCFGLDIVAWQRKLNHSHTMKSFFDLM